MKAETRARNLGWITPPRLDSGPQNALTDIPGVLVGHTTLIEGDPAPLEIGRGPIRTGVNAIRPHSGNLFAEKVAAAVYVLNGFGKTTGLDGHVAPALPIAKIQNGLKQFIQSKL